MACHGLSERGGRAVTGLQDRQKQERILCFLARTRWKGQARQELQQLLLDYPEELPETILQLYRAAAANKEQAAHLLYRRKHVATRSQ
jgi:hypothetical protein